MFMFRKPERETRERLLGGVAYDNLNLYMDEKP